VPEGWEWTRLGTISNIVTGRLDANAQTPDGEYPFFTCGEEVFKTDSFAFDCNAILLGGNNATGDFKMHRFSGKFNAYQRVYVITTFPEIDADYLYSHIQYYLPKLQLQSIGSQTRYLKLGMITELLIALPALDEQKCISESCNKYLNYCTEIACEKDSLKDIIKSAKSKILDLAIRGKLVPQDPNDEPASVLLERIRAEKEELIKQGKIKRDKKESIIFRGDDNSYYEKFFDGKERCIDEELPFELPNGWEWCNLSMIGTTNIGLTYRPTDIIDDGTIVLRSNNIVNDEIDLDNLIRVETKIRDNQYVQPNDILICARNGSKALVGKCALIGNMEELASFGAFMAIYRTDYYKYVLHYLRSNLFRNVFNDSNSTAINQLTQDMLKRAVIPFPPFEEQLRIVELTDKLLLKIKDIERSLN